MSGRSEPLAAIVLAGGRGSRMGGRDKAGLRLAGERMVDRVVAAARRAGADPVVVAGPAHAAPEGCLVAREDPPFSGPLAALAAALDALPPATSAWHGGSVLLLSCDLVRPAAVVARLREAAIQEDADATVLRDPDGREQWLAGCYRLRELRAGVAALGSETADRPLRLAFGGLRVGYRSAEAALIADVDTPEDLERARAAGAPEGEAAESDSEGDRRQ
uniref:molybdenum cofactor guanylyltransferase n=1 Tax=Leucobacter soli TaxID=2812850 RepID=UPI001C407F49|nr:NTP transferase domain-containing protein [Leucobacter soli]